MKNFQRKDLYDNEIGLFREVIKTRVETLSEYNEKGRYRIGNETEEEPVDEFTGLDFGEFSGTFEGGFGSYDDVGFGEGLSSYDSNQGQDDYSQSLPDDEWETTQPKFMKILTSVLWVTIYGVKGLMNDSPFKAPEEGERRHSKTLYALAYAGFGLAVLSFLQYTQIIDILVQPFLGIVLGLGVAGLSDYTNNKYYDVGLTQRFFDVDEEDALDDNRPVDIEDMEDMDEELDFESDNDDVFGSFNGFDDVGGLDSLANEYDLDDDEDIFDDDPELGSNDDDIVQRLFPDSPIGQTKSEVEYEERLLEVFRDGNKNKGLIPRTREDLLPAFAPYLTANDKSFARWYTIREHSMEYDNIAFTLYKSLVQINGKFDISNGSKEPLTIFSMQRTPLLYKIEVKLPTYFKEAQILKSAKIVENYLKMSDKDTSVSCIITTFNGNYIFKFLRLDYRGLISHGDIARYVDPETGETALNDLSKDKGLPILMGMRDNEYPYVFDLEENTSGAIVGGSGSGKSWLTFQLMINLLTLNTPEELNFLILDAKDATMWGEFSKAPHVLGYHTDIYSYINILTEIQAEHLRRAAYLKDLGIEDYKTYRKVYKARGDYEELAKHPFLVIVIDEITYTMTTLANNDQEVFKEFKSLLTSLGTVIRSTGMRIVVIGQRSIDSSIPRNFMANASMKFAMRMDSASDIEVMMGKRHLEASKEPNAAGESIMDVQGQPQAQYVKTLIPGGFDTQPLTQTIRVIALDWVRRTIGTDTDYYKPPVLMRDTIKVGFNRDTFYVGALSDLKDGRILSNSIVSNGYQINIDPGKPANTSNRFGVNEQQVIFGKEDEEFIVDIDVDTPQVIESDDEHEDDALFGNPHDINDLFDDFNSGFGEDELTLVEFEDEDDTNQDDTLEWESDRQESDSINEVQADDLFGTLNKSFGNDSDYGFNDTEFNDTESNDTESNDTDFNDSEFNDTEFNVVQADDLFSEVGTNNQENSIRDEGLIFNEGIEDDEDEGDSLEDLLNALDDAGSTNESESIIQKTQDPKKQTTPLFKTALKPHTDKTQPTSPPIQQDKPIVDATKEQGAIRLEQEQRELEEERRRMQEELTRYQQKLQEEKEELERIQRDKDEQERWYKQQMEELAQQVEQTIISEEPRQEELPKVNEEPKFKGNTKDVRKSVKTSTNKSATKSNVIQPSYVQSNHVTGKYPLTKEEVQAKNLGVKQYILKYGENIDILTKAVPKEVINELFSKRDIKTAQHTQLIYATEDAYVAVSI